MSKVLRTTQTAQTAQTPQQRQHVVLQIIQPGLAGPLAYFVVGCELLIIAYIRYRFFSSSFWISAIEVIVGGSLVFAAGVIIGSS